MIRLKRPSRPEQRRIERETTTYTLALFLAIVPFLGFYGMVNLLEHLGVLPAHWLDIVFGRAEPNTEAGKGFLVMVAVYGCSYILTWILLRRMRRASKRETP